MHAYIQAERVGVLECLQALGRALPRNPRGAPALSVVETVTGMFHFFNSIVFLAWALVLCATHARHVPVHTHARHVPGCLLPL